MYFHYQGRVPSQGRHCPDVTIHPTGEALGSLGHTRNGSVELCKQGDTALGLSQKSLNASLR